MATDAASNALDRRIGMWASGVALPPASVCSKGPAPRERLSAASNRRASEVSAGSVATQAAQRCSSSISRKMIPRRRIAAPA